MSYEGTYIEVEEDIICVIRTRLAKAVRNFNSLGANESIEPLQLRIDVTSMGVLYHFCQGKCSMELFLLVPLCPFLYTIKSNFKVVDILSRTKRFDSSFICQSLKTWNSLSAHVFLSHNHSGSFKRCVNKFLTRPSGFLSNKEFGRPYIEN